MRERNRPVEAEPHRDPAFENMLRTVEEMDTPEGYKAELIRGKIIVSPWPELRCMRPMLSLREQLGRHAPEDHVADSAPFLFSFPSVGRAYGPNFYVVDRAAFLTEERHGDGEALSLVAEFTSASTRDADWQEKLQVYGRLVPVYLVVDMQEEEITCFSDPSPQGYRAHRTVSFGTPLPVPAPFSCEIDTTAFKAAAG
ncbi:Uma2 family endonuclease [Streptomyces sp. NPDC047976]|uniref:Uma2 family endonuclease n=1 Tax=unclassified Streptomyces TaxID=2593676 RepID=UPI00344A46CD